MYRISFRLWLIVGFVFATNILLSQDFELYGKVFQSDDKKPIELANVYLKNNKIGTASNPKGLYQLQISDSMLNDTIVVSAIGYKSIEVPINSIFPKKKYHFALQDSLFLLDEVVAFCYNYVEGMYWKNPRKNEQKFLLSFVSKDEVNFSNFLLLLKSRLGKPKKRNDSYVWKRCKLPGVKKKTTIVLKSNSCDHCPDQGNLVVTIDAKNRAIPDILLEDSYQDILKKYFQEILDQSFEQGVNMSQLEKRKRIYYLLGSENTYTGKVYGYFKEGQKGLKGEMIDGKRHQRWEYWFKNGHKKMVAFYDMGKKVGTHVSWYKDGGIRIKNQYENGRLTDNNFWWHENGTIKKIAIYKKGVLQGTIEWEEDGSLKNKKGAFETMQSSDIEKIKSMKTKQSSIVDFLMRFL